MPSRLIDGAVDQIAGLARRGRVGRKRIAAVALALVVAHEADVRRFTEAIQEMKEGVKACARYCGNLGEEEQCSFCLDARREDEPDCGGGEDLRDLLAIEGTGSLSVGGTTCWAGSSVPWTGWVRRICGWRSLGPAGVE